ncbi:MAG TPA: peptidylprolyl isomerase [Candidatus Deferrimicrobiaceae bacterium]|jgi:parvulin-like peptidyl-prolyl isomerase
MAAPVLALCLFAAVGCSGPDSSKTASPARDNALADNALAATAPSLPSDNMAAVDAALAGASPKPLFLVNQVPVPAIEFRMYMDVIAGPEAQKGPQVLPELVDSMINNRLLATMAVKEGVDKLPRSRSKIESRCNQIWKDVLWTRVVQPSIKVTDKEVLAKAPKFEELVSVQQFIADSPEKAEQFRKRMAAGESFDDVAKQESLGLTAKNGGKVGYIKRGSTMYDPKVIASIFRLKKGELSPVIETTLGQSVFRLLDRKMPESQKIEWLPNGRKEVLAQKGKQVWDDYKAKVIKKHKIVLNKAVIDGYMKARANKQSIEPLMLKSAFKVDSVDFFLVDLVDPSGTGLIHGENTLEIIANKRAEDYAVAQEVARLGLKAQEPARSLQEKLLTEEVLAREFINYRCRDIQVTGPEMKDYYDKHLAEFSVGHSLDVSLIETKSKSRLDEIYGLLAKGTPFEEVAEKWSDNKTLKGGRLGFVPEATIAPQFADVKKLKVGEYSKEPIKLRAKKENVDLYIVARVNGVREKGVIPFEQADKPSLEKAVMAGKREGVVKSVLSGLKKNNKIQFTPEYDRFSSTYSKMSSKEGRMK